MLVQKLRLICALYGLIYAKMMCIAAISFLCMVLMPTLTTTWSVSCAHASWLLTISPCVSITTVLARWLLGVREQRLQEVCNNIAIGNFLIAETVTVFLCSVRNVRLSESTHAAAASKFYLGTNVHPWQQF